MEALFPADASLPSATSPSPARPRPNPNSHRQRPRPSPHREKRATDRCILPPPFPPPSTSSGSSPHHLSRSTGPGSTPTCSVSGWRPNHAGHPGRGRERVGGPTGSGREATQGSVGGFESEILELDPNRRIVLRWGFVGPARTDGPVFDSRLTVTLTEAPGQSTRLTLVHERLEALRESMPQVATSVGAGWSMVLDRLASTSSGRLLPDPARQRRGSSGQVAGSQVASSRGTIGRPHPPSGGPRVQSPRRHSSAATAAPTDAATARPPTPSGAAAAGAADRLHIVPWLDPVADPHGLHPCSRYVELYWLGIVGPSTTWLLRRFSYGLEMHPGAGYRSRRDGPLAGPRREDG